MNFEGLGTIYESLGQYDQIPMTEENIKKYKSKAKGLSHIRTGEDYTGAIILDNKDVVGFYNLRKSDRYIQALEVIEDYQSKGIGSQLLQECINKGATKLSVNKKNEKAINLYKKRNFKVVKEDNTMYYMELNKKVHGLKESYSNIPELNEDYKKYITQNFEDTLKAEEESIEKFGLSIRERYESIFDDICSRQYLNENVNESTALQNEDFVRSVGYRIPTDNITCLPYFTPQELEDIVFKEGVEQPEWFKEYKLLQNGILSERFIELNKQRLNDLYENINEDADTILKLGWTPDIPLTSDNLEKVSATTAFRIRCNICTNEFYDATCLHDDEYIKESIETGKYIYVDIDKFITGKNNVCLITGLSGSGKTTLAKEMASKYNATIVSLDSFTGKYGEINHDPVLDSYMKKNKKLAKDLEEGNLDNNAIAYEMDKYLQYAISYCNKDTNNKYIIEGVQIYWLMNGKDLKGCSLVCVDASAVKSALQRVKRSNKLNKEANTNLIGKLSDALQSAKINKDDIRGYKDFKKEVREGLTEATKDNKNPVYIILVYTASTFGKMIKEYTHGIYTHAAMSLDNSLNKLYSFNLNNQFNKLGGFSIESIEGYKKDNKDAIMCVYTTFIDDDKKRKLDKQINYFIGNIDKTKYSIINVLGLIANKPIELANDMICSQFVDRMLKSVDIDVTGMASSLVTPNDIYKSTSNKIYKVYEGRVDEYNHKKIQAKVNKLRRSSITEAKSAPVQFDKDGNLLIIKNIKDVQEEYNKCHKLLLSYDSSENIEGMKHELYKLWYLNLILERKIYKNKKPEKEYHDMRARILNDFNKYLKIVNKAEPDFDFTSGYEESPYSDAAIKINSHTLKYGVKYSKSLFKLFETVL